MKSWAVLAGFLVSLGIPSASAGNGVSPCPRLRFSGRPPTPPLNEVEKRLVCGDPRSDGWRDIPLPQARAFLAAFLESRGYYFPSFSNEGRTLVVDAGEPTVVRSLVGEGLGGIYDLGKRRKVRGQLLTPKLLDKVKADVQFELQSRGYPCPRVDVGADARTGEVRVDVRAGRRSTISGLVPARLRHVDPGIFGRYEAFEAGHTLYDTRLLSLTGDRIKQDQLFLSAYYDTQCSTGDLRIVQHAVEGPPVLVVVGVGFDSEGYLIGKLRLQETRLGSRAGSAEADVFASELEQSLDVWLRDSFRPGARLFLRPEAFVRRENEINYEAAHGQVNLEPGWSRDGDDLRLEVRGGPAYEHFDTLRGLGPAASWFEFVTHGQIMTHLYEFYQRDPRQGWSARLDTSSRVAGAESRVTAHRIQAVGEALWNIGGFEPPLTILATRGTYGTILIGGPLENVYAQISPADRFFLGGDADLRGFARQSVPNDGTGFLTEAYQGVELRAGDILPKRLQPFVFVDAAMAGRREGELDPDVYYSPGGGLRWASPFGAIRGTVGRGLTWVRGGPTPAPKPRWQLFLSFGKEF